MVAVLIRSIISGGTKVSSMDEGVQLSNFDVGLLQKYVAMDSSEIVPSLQASRSFSPIKREGFFDSVAANIHVFEEQVTKALDDEIEWTQVCDEPKSSLGLDKQWHVDTKKKAEQKTETEKFFGVENKLMEALYYTVYVIVLWRNKSALCRYQSAIEPFEVFKARYSADTMYVNQKQYDLSFMSKDEWTLFFRYRNIVILASAVSPKKASQKCIFMKIMGCLVEDKIHATGSKQSHAAARIAHIYDREGGTFNQRKSEHLNGAITKITRKRPKKTDDGGDPLAMLMNTTVDDAAGKLGSGSKARKLDTSSVMGLTDHTDTLADILLSLSGGPSRSNSICAHPDEMDADTGVETGVGQLLALPFPPLQSSSSSSGARTEPTPTPPMKLTPTLQLLMDSTKAAETDISTDYCRNRNVNFALEYTSDIDVTAVAGRNVDVKSDSDRSATVVSVDPSSETEVRVDNGSDDDEEVQDDDKETNKEGYMTDVGYNAVTLTAPFSFDSSGSSTAAVVSPDGLVSAQHAISPPPTECQGDVSDPGMDTEGMDVNKMMVHASQHINAEYLS